MYNILKEYGIMNKLQCITTDNALNNYMLTWELSMKLHEAGIEWNNETHHLPYLAHVINLFVKKFLSVIQKKPQSRVTQIDDHESDTEYNIDFNLDDIPEADGTALRVVLATIARLATSLRQSTTRWKIFQAACKSYNINPMTILFAMDVWFSLHYR